MKDPFVDSLYMRHQSCPSCPSPVVVIAWYDALLGTLFPDFSRVRAQSFEDFHIHYKSLQKDLVDILNGHSGDLKTSQNAAGTFFESVPALFHKLEHDVIGIYEGDPAAKSKTEVIKSYPGFYAIAAYRVANALHQQNITLIPRVISEHAHSKTGIDIHPAAQIGSYFCIDHGTGVVIGETTVIGDHVKIYQGVTLGALSVNKADAKLKRHPTIEDHVVIYSGATILGGKTTIGQHSIIGGNVWLTSSVPAHSKIYYSPDNSSLRMDSLLKTSKA
jgi:serine O-acetyltransferase